MKKVGTAKIRTRAPFCELFRVDPRVLDAIQEHMRINGYDRSCPITLWKEEMIVLDGHTRLRAAQNVGLSEVPVVVLSFGDERAALDYAIHNQRDRRNLTESQILSLIELIDTKYPRGRGQAGQQKVPRGAFRKSAETTARTIGVSPRKVERARKVLQSGDESIKEMVRKGEMSINQASKTVGAGKAEERDLLDKAPAGTGLARWAWNPIVGAGDYRLSDEMLSIPASMAPPKGLTPDERNILVCPEIDLFSGSVDMGSIKKVLHAVKTAPVGWNFIFLTKHPAPLTGLDWGRNCWVGVIVDNQKEARAAEEAFEKIGKQVVRFICCERRERLISLHFKLFDWLVLRGQSEPDWGKTLIINAWEAHCPLYLESDLRARL